MVFGGGLLLEISIDYLIFPTQNNSDNGPLYWFLDHAVSAQGKKRYVLKAPSQDTLLSWYSQHKLKLMSKILFSASPLSSPKIPLKKNHRRTTVTYWKPLLCPSQTQLQFMISDILFSDSTLSSPKSLWKKIIGEPHWCITTCLSALTNSVWIHDLQPIPWNPALG